MKDIMIRIQNAENERDLIAEENKKLKKIKKELDEKIDFLQHHTQVITAERDQLGVILEREREELREITAQRDEIETERDELKAERDKELADMNKVLEKYALKISYEDVKNKSGCR